VVVIWPEVSPRDNDNWVLEAAWNRTLLSVEIEKPEQTPKRKIIPCKLLSTHVDIS